MWAKTRIHPPSVVNTDSNPWGKFLKSENEGRWWPTWQVVHPKKTPQKRSPIPTIARTTKITSWCFLQPMKKEKEVKGTTNANIQKWNLWSTQNELAIIGRTTISTGVNRQWTAQSNAIPTPIRSNQRKWSQGEVEWFEFTSKIIKQMSSFCKTFANKDERMS